jgi:chromosome partitioning protein
MKVIAVVNSKGGTGKTTLASALSVRAAQESKRVAMVDLDPQKSLVAWWQRRGKTDNPTIFEGAETAADALEALAHTGWDWVFLDGPPKDLLVIEEMINAADFVLIPSKASMADIHASQDAIAMARGANATFAVMFNEVGARERIAEKAREFLASVDVPLLNTDITRRTSHITGMTVGKSAAEVNGGRDAAAAAEIDALWREVKAAANRAVRARKREAVRG